MFPEVMGSNYGEASLREELKYLAKDYDNAYVIKDAYFPGGMKALFALCTGDTVLLINRLGIEDPGYYSSFVDHLGNTIICHKGSPYMDMGELDSLNKFRSDYPGFGKVAKVKFMYILDGPIVVPEATRNTKSQNVCTRDSVKTTVNRLLMDTKDHNEEDRIVATIAYFAGEPNTGITAYRRVSSFYWMLGYVFALLSLVIPGMFIVSLLTLVFTIRMYKDISLKPLSYIIYTRLCWPITVLGMLLTIRQMM